MVPAYFGGWEKPTSLIKERERLGSSAACGLAGLRERSKEFSASREDGWDLFFLGTPAGIDLGGAN